MDWSPKLVLRFFLGLAVLSLVSSHVVFRKQLTLKYRHLRRHLKKSESKLDALPEDDPRAAAIDDAMDRLVKLVQDVNEGDHPCVKPDAMINIGSDASVVVNVPSQFHQCKVKYAKTPMSDKNANIWCLRDSIWKYQAGGGSDTVEIKGNATYTKKSRSKRNVHWDNLIEDLEDGFESPRRGFRMRQEYRTLSRRQRRRFHRALRRLYRDGTFQKFGEVHKDALSSGGAHNGIAFLAWHRAFLSLFEEQLRRVSRNRVSLPYWNSNIDRRLGGLAWRSIMWDEDHLGTGTGVVDNGPFEGWVTEDGPLNRNINAQGGLIRLRQIRQFMRQCQLGNAHSGWESAHNNVHNWVGGNMRGRNSAYDPVFYLHHCFIDYQWEQFRKHQRDDCNIDPSQDYPEASTIEHDADTAMVGMEFLTNRDGIADFWTDNWFGYEDSPTCANDCGDTPDLVCNTRRNRCDTVRMEDDRRKRRKRQAPYYGKENITPNATKQDEAKPTKMPSRNDDVKTTSLYEFQRRESECKSSPYLDTCPSDPAPNTIDGIVEAIWLDEIPTIDEVETIRKAADEAKRRVESIPPDTSPNVFPEFPEPADEEDEEGEYSMNRETSVYRFLEITVKRQGYLTTDTGRYRAREIKVAALNRRE